MYLIQATTTPMSATTTFEMPIALDSLYIPRVYANITTEFIAETFENLDLGTVDRVEAVPRDGDNTSYMAFVYFSSWNTQNKAAVNLANRIKCPKPGESQARIVYDDPWFWILLPNKSEKKAPVASLTSEETVDILYDMVEDLQTRLLESKKEHELEMNEMKMELSHLREMLLFDPAPPSPPKLVRQIATAGTSSPPVPPCPPPIGGRRERVCEPEKSIDLSNVLFPMQSPQLPPSPFRIEPTHFHSRWSVHLSLKFLAHAFGENDVAIKRFETEKCKFTCSYYYGYELTEFVVRVFSTGDDDEECLVEFQRRSGDRVGFFRIYDSIYSEVFDMIDATVPPSPQSYDQYIPKEFRKTPSIPINFTECLRSTIAKHIAEGDNQLYAPAENTEWFPTDEEVAEYREDRQRRRMEEANIPPMPAMIQRQTAQWWPTEEEIENYPQFCEERSRAVNDIPTMHMTEQGNMVVDKMGLVHSSDDKHFWCDP